MTEFPPGLGSPHQDNKPDRFQESIAISDLSLSRLPFEKKSHLSHPKDPLEEVKAVTEEKEKKQQSRVEIEKKKTNGWFDFLWCCAD